MLLGVGLTVALITILTGCTTRFSIPITDKAAIGITIASYLETTEPLPPIWTDK